MGKIKTGFTYLFFFLYSYNKVRGNILVELKAIIMMIGLEFAFAFSVFAYYTDYYKINVVLNGNKYNLFLCAFPIIVIHFWIFDRNKNWKKYISQFEVWPEEKRKKWDRIMRGIIFFIIANLLLSFYFMASIDWTQYR